jgi:hypothetical protein
VQADFSWHGRLVSSFFQVIPHIHLTWQRSYLGTENVMMRHDIDRTFFLNDSTAPSGPGPPHYRGFTSHSNTPYLVGFLWASDQPDAENLTWQHTTLTTERQPCLRRD